MKKANTKLIKKVFGVGGQSSLWCTAEVHELKNLLVEGEEITGLVKGWYAGGFALLLATNQRILVVDKKPLFLGVEDIRYEMVCQIDYSWQWFQANVMICTVNKELKFITFDKAQLRTLASYVQQRIMDLRRPHQLRPVSAQQPIGSEDHGHFSPGRLLRSVGSIATMQNLPTESHPYTKNSLSVSHRY